jgi:hypothetical protein
MFEEDILESLLQLLFSQSKKNDLPYTTHLVSVVSREMLKIINQEEFIALPAYRQLLHNFLFLLKKILEQRPAESVQTKVDLVDLTFNLKSELFSLFSRLGKGHGDIKEFIQGAADTIDTIECEFLERPAADYISHLSHILEEDRDAPLGLLTSVSLKHIYFLIYPDCFDF